MAKLMEERRMTVRRLGLVGAACLVMGGLAAGCKSSAPIPAPFVGKGDTPVVLVGGSLTAKAPIKAWQPATMGLKEYFVSPGDPVQTIVVKATSTQDTGDGSVGGDKSAPDTIKVDVSQAQSWEIDEFTTGNVQVASLILNGDGNIHFARSNNFTLCPNNSFHRIAVTQDAQCNHLVPFSQVTISVIYAGHPSQTIGTLTCIDQNFNPGTCRIVLKN